jgi:glycosyltransferase involved in cell wall biosynthesis
MRTEGPMPLVSIIIPCYNQGRFLDAAIHSALEQTHQDLEVIVINDGSADETEQVARRHERDPRFHLINQNNAGLPAARNRGIRESKGVFLNFLDSDDWLESDMVQHLVAVLEENPDIGFAYCDVHIVSAEGSPENQYSVGKSRQTVNGDIFDSLILGGYFPPQTVLMRRLVLDNIGYFDEVLGGHADYDLWLRAAGHGYRALYLDKKLACYRMHGENMSFNLQHMQATRKASLAKIARLFPDRLAEAVSRAIDSSEQMHSAQTWLNDQYLNYLELKKWVDELQKGKDWLHGQWEKLVEAVNARDKIILTLRQRLRELGANDPTKTDL